MLKAAMMTMALAGLMMAQGPGSGRGPGLGAGTPPSPDALKEFLGLTDAQVQQLVELRKSQPAAVQPLREQLRTKAEAMREEMQKANPDTNKVAQLMVEMKAIREQIRAEHGKLNDQAKALLTEEQKVKLAQLEAAQKLAPAIRQGIGLGLLSGPEGAGAGRGGPAMLGPGPGAGPGMGFSGGRGARGFRGPMI
jgi:Spy/CpxP family protein refolding chaperone